MTNRHLRWLGLGTASLSALLAVGVGLIFLASERTLAQRFEAPPQSLVEPSAAQIADAPRQARILGCISCHGEGLAGRTIADIPNVVRVYAPNLTEIAARASDRQLAAAIRQGIGHDGRALFVMPSQAYAGLADGEVAALIGWIRSMKHRPGSTAGVTVRPLGRIAIARGELRPAAAKIEEYRSQAPIDLGPRHAAGRRIAANVCADCHGPALLGMTSEAGEAAPDLSRAGAYELDQFRTLMLTGRPVDGRDLGLMTKVARADFSQLSDGEIRALHAYLRARAARLAS